MSLIRNTFFVTVAIVVLSLALFKYISPSSRKARSLYETMSLKDVVSMTIEIDRERQALRCVFVVKDRLTLQSLVGALKGNEMYSVAHPDVVTSAALTIQLNNGRRIDALLRRTSNIGDYIVLLSKIPDGIVYGNYSIRRDLFFVLANDLDAAKYGRCVPMN